MIQLAEFIRPKQIVPVNSATRREQRLSSRILHYGYCLCWRGVLSFGRQTIWATVNWATDQLGDN